jgi:hypothetical protein
MKQTFTLLSNSSILVLYLKAMFKSFRVNGLLDGCHDTQHNGPQYRYAECHYAEYHSLCLVSFMLSVIMLNVIYRMLLY